MPGWFQFNNLSDSETSLSDEDRKLIDKLADKIVSMGMSVPAIFFIESTKPLSFIGSQVMVFFGPFLELFFPGKTFYQLTSILEDRKNLDYVLQVIEEKEDQRSKEKDRKKPKNRSRYIRLFNRKGKV